MRRCNRIVLLAGLVALAPVLAGCENFDMDKLDVFHLNDKKPLPGDRKELFPNGVPGVSQGIPPEYMKGNQPPPETAQTLPAQPDNKPAANAPGDKSAATAAPPSRTAVVEPAQIVPEAQGEAKPKPKPKPKAKAKAKPKPKPHPTQVTIQPAANQQSQPAWPEPAPQPQQQAAPPWPNSGPATTEQPWPSAPSPGNVSR